eukprot:TCONS_00010938-protein
MLSLRSLVFVFCCALVFGAVEDSKDGVEFEVGGKPDQANIKRLFTKLKTVPAFDDTESSGDSDDTEKGSGEEGDSEEGSGSGSGVGDGNEPSIVVVQTVEPTTKAKTTKAIEKSTVVDINEVTTDEPKQKTTQGNDIIIDAGKPTILYGGDEENNNVDDELPTSRQQQKQQKQNDEPTGVNFTVGIIVGVVVGAILAILVIVFLVYRLRKKDEGSYSLDEPSSQAFIRDEKSNPGQGKEYYA